MLHFAASVHHDVSLSKRAGVFHQTSTRKCTHLCTEDPFLLEAMQIHQAFVLYLKAGSPQIKNQVLALYFIAPWLRGLQTWVENDRLLAELTFPVKQLKKHTPPDRTITGSHAWARRRLSDCTRQREGGRGDETRMAGEAEIKHGDGKKEEESHRRD